MLRESKLRPLLSENQLMHYFKDKLPPEIDRREYMTGVLSCMGYARLILNELGGPDRARIYWITNSETDTGHAYVAPITFSPRRLALNSFLITGKLGPHTVGYVRKNGDDITEEIVGYSWSML